MVAVDEEARDPPIGRGLAELGEAAHPRGKLLRRAELAPPDDVSGRVDKGRVRAPVAHEPLLVLAILLRRLRRSGNRGVESDAPAPAPDSVVLLHHADEVGPRLRRKLLHSEAGHGPDCDKRRCPDVGDNEREGMIRNLVGGQWRGPVAGTASLPVFNPATGEEIDHVPLSGAAEVDAAVRAAAAAFPSWSRTAVMERVRLMFNFKALLEKHFEDLAALTTRHHGKTLEE